MDEKALLVERRLYDIIIELFNQNEIQPAAGELIINSVKGRFADHATRLMASEILELKKELKEKERDT